MPAKTEGSDSDIFVRDLLRNIFRTYRIVGEEKRGCRWSRLAICKQNFRVNMTNFFDYNEVQPRKEV